MPLELPQPILYAITSGATSGRTIRDAPELDVPQFASISNVPEFASISNVPEFASILRLVETAVSRQIPRFPLRETRLPTRTLSDLVSQAVEITRGSGTRLL